MAEKIVLIDGNSLMHRAFHALPPLTTSKGVFTNAVYGFTTMLFRLIDEEQPDYIAVAFDKKGPTFRHIEYSAYKANRKQTPDELGSQFPLVKQVLKAMKIEIFEAEGYEADDVLGTLSKKAENAGLDVLLVTGDKDALQLVTEKTSVLLTRRGISEMERYGIKEVKQRYGVLPPQLVDIKGLMGDPSDNIPGVPRVGEKTALKLIQEFGSIENLMEHLDAVKSPALRESLEQYKDQAFMSRNLARIITDLPLELDLYRVEYNTPDAKELAGLFSTLEFHTLLKKIDVPETGNSLGSTHYKTVIDRGALDMVVEEIRKAGRLSFHIQSDSTNAMEGKMYGIAVGLSPEKIYYIPTAPYTTGEALSKPEVLEALKPVLEDCDIKKSGIDLKFNLIMLRRRGVDLKGIDFDIAVASYLLDPSRSTHEIEKIAAEALRIKLPTLEDLIGKGKNRIDLSEVSLGALADFACKRLQVVEMLRDDMIARLEQDELKPLFDRVEMPLIDVLAEMEINGFTVDTAELAKLSEEFGFRIDELTAKIYSSAGMEFNINSTKQLGEVLFGKLGLAPLKKTKTGFSTSAEVLEELRPAHEIIDYILEYRTLMKLKSTYVDGLMAVINPVSRKVHSSFNQTITATGRISSTEPNLQNIPVRLDMGRRIRRVFVPEGPDRVLLAGDYSQIELRVLAHISEDKNLIEAFEKDQDIHTRTASEVFGVPMEEVTPLMRSRAKAVNFGIVYGISDFGLAKDLGISRREASDYIDSYFRRYPGVRDYVREIVISAKLLGYVTTILNRRRYLPDLNSRNFSLRSFAERTAMNTPIQGSAADIIKVAMINVYNRLKTDFPDAKLLLQVHDELILDVPEKDVREIAAMMKREMEGAVKLRVPLKVDVKSGCNWMEMRHLNL